MRFRWKLMLSFMVLVTTMATLFYLLFDRTLNDYAVDESQAQLHQQARLARLLIEREENLDFQLKARSIGEVIKARVTILNPAGIVIGDSEVTENDLPGLDSHANRPEIRMAASVGVGTAIRYSSTIRMDMLYTALPFKTGSSGGFVRLAIPLDSLSSIRATLHGMIVGAIALAVLISLLLSYLLSRLFFKRIETISAAAGRIGSGELDLRLPVAGNDEVSALAVVMNEMSGRIKEQLQNIAAEKQQLDAILHGMGEGVMVVAEDGTITLVNPVFRSMFSIDGEVVGKSFIEVSRNPDLLGAYQEQQQTSGELLREIVIHPQGLALLTHWVPLVIDGDRKAVVAVFHDISDMKKSESMRRDFVANVSHELRTPVTIIKGYAETLLDGVLESDPERSRRFVEIIFGHAGRLTSLISDLLTLSKMEARGAMLELTSINPADVVRQAVEITAAQAVERNITVNSYLPEEPTHIQGDIGRLEQVMVNLLDNAIKYTPLHGNVGIFIDNQGEYIVISVEDSGIGIPAKDLPRIFERFYRVDEARSRDQGGTGLGLAIVKHIVQLHGGDMSVISTPGKGSTFSFTLRKA